MTRGLAIHLLGDATEAEIMKATSVAAHPS